MFLHNKSVLHLETYEFLKHINYLNAIRCCLIVRIKIDSLMFV